MVKKTKTRKEWSPVGYIKAHLRKIWRWSPQRRACLQATVCAICGKKAGKLLADHIEPVIEPRIGFEGWDIYIERMFNGKLQALCKPCHSIKTKEENAVRRKSKKALNG